LIVLAEADVKIVPSVTHARSGILTGKGATMKPKAVVEATRTIKKTKRIKLF
jgi:hypothetical protein